MCNISTVGGNKITYDGICTREIKSRIAMQKAAFQKRKALFTSKLELYLGKKLVKCYIWSAALWRWNLDTSESRSEIHRKFWKCVAGEGWKSAGPIAREMMCWMVLRGRGMPYIQYKRGGLTGLVTSWVGTVFWKRLLKERDKWREEEGEEVNSYRMTIREKEGVGSSKGKHHNALSREIYLKVSVDLS